MDKDEDLYKASMVDQICYAVTYGEFMYRTGPCEYLGRVVFKIEKPYGQMTYMHTFICRCQVISSKCQMNADYSTSMEEIKK